MLDNDIQLEAYKALVAAGGLITPESATYSSQAAGLATTDATALSALVLSTVSYPSTVQEPISSISAMATELLSVSATAAAHAKLITTHCDPSTLIRLNIGWDIYCRANSLSESELAISAATGDATQAGALNNALQNVELTDVTAAMTDINTTLAVVGTTSPTLTSEQIAALADAVATLEVQLSNVRSAGAELSTLYQLAETSTTEADNAYNQGISIALISSTINSASVSGAVSAITPPAVLAILKEA